MAGVAEFGACEERLSTTLGEILLRNLQPGTTYHLTSMVQLPLTLNYEGDHPITLKLDPVLPDVNEGKAGFEPIPNLNWIGVEPSSFDIQSSSTVYSNVTIALPEDASLRGKKFIAYIWSKSLSKEGAVSVGVGVKSRILLTVAQETGNAEDSPKSSYLNFKVDPATVLIEKVKPGKMISVNRKTHKTLKVINTGDQTMEFKLQFVSGDSLDLPAPSGLSWGPDSTEFKIQPSTLKIKSGKAGKFKVYLKVPEQSQYYGKEFQYLLRVTPQGSGLTSGVLFRVTVKTVEEYEYKIKK